LFVPYSDHIIVHLFQLGLGGVERVLGRVELIGLEALIGETDLKGLLVFL
jgi:hypothetical protein